MTKLQKERMHEAALYVAENSKCCDQPLSENSAFGLGVEAVAIASGLEPAKWPELKQWAAAQVEGQQK